MPIFGRLESAPFLLTKAWNVTLVRTEYITTRIVAHHLSKLWFTRSLGSVPCITRHRVELFEPRCTE
jgi:hypothetical protein